MRKEEVFQKELEDVLSHMDDRNKFRHLRFFLALLKLRHVRAYPYLNIVYAAYEEFVKSFSHESDTVEAMKSLMFKVCRIPTIFVDVTDEEAENIRNMIFDMLPEEARIIRKHIEEKFKTKTYDLYNDSDLADGDGMTIGYGFIEIRNSGCLDEFRIIKKEGMTTESVLDALEEYFIFEPNHPLNDYQRDIHDMMTVWRGKERLFINVSDGIGDIFVSIQN